MKRGLKRGIALLLALVMGVSTTAVSAYAEAAAETGKVQSGWDGVTTVNKYAGENYSVTFSLADYWNGGYNAGIKIENTGSSVIENWYLSFVSENKLTSIWNAEAVSNENGEYVVKNAGWNADIPVDGSVEFGISVNENFAGFPSAYRLWGESMQVQEEAYSVEYILDSDWGSGFTARVLLGNHTEEVLEDWTLEFDFDREITSIWNGVIETHEGNHYVIKNAGYNANIATGSAISVGFNGTEGVPENEPSAYLLYSYNGSGADKEIDLTLDTDNDGVEDYVEEYFETDKKKEDTDGDGLSDDIELYSFVLNPLKQDTDANGIKDADEDLDKDGLSNIFECSIGTSIMEVDTDGDGLTDAEESRVYGTNPLLVDTDGDGASDSKEIEFGTNPLVKEDSFAVTQRATGEDTVTVSVETTLTGEQLESLTVEKYENEFFFPSDMPGYIGSAYDFNVEGSFDKATIRFEFDEDLLDSPEFDPVIYYFNEENQLLEELKTTVSGNIASAEVIHFSKYILLNRKGYQKAFKWEDVWSTTGYSGVEVVLVIDDSFSMETNDSLNVRLKVAQDLIDKLPENSKVGVVRFTEYTYDLTNGVTEDVELAKSYLTTKHFPLGSGTKMYTAIDYALSMYEAKDDTILKMMVVLSDGETFDITTRLSVIDKAKKENVKVHTIGLGSSKSSYFSYYLQPLAQSTEGTFYLAEDASQLADVYNDINKKIDIETDSDNDGIADYYEENMVQFNGVTIKLNKNNPDSDGDGVLDGEEVVELNYRYNEDRTRVIVTGVLLSDPLNPDSDNDGLSDEEELILGTSLRVADTDGDGLDDFTKVENGFDPLDRDPDRDGRLDLQEFQEGTSPYYYDKSWNEYLGDFVKGFIAGDFIKDAENAAVVMGQISSSFIPFIDIRDVVGNLVHGDFAFAGLSAIGLVPVVGDGAKASGKVVKFVIKQADDVPSMINLFEGILKNYPELATKISKNDMFSEMVEKLAKADTSKLTKRDREIYETFLRKAGVPEDVIKGGRKSSELVLKGTEYSTEYAQKLKDTYKVFQNNGYEISEHGLNRVLGRINQGKIGSLDDVIDTLNNGMKYRDTVNGGMILFKDGISIHVTENGFIKTVIGQAKIKSTWEVLR